MDVNARSVVINTSFGTITATKEAIHNVQVVARHSADYSMPTILEIVFLESSVATIFGDLTASVETTEIRARHSSLHSIVTGQTHNSLYTIISSGKARHQGNYALLLSAKHFSRHAMREGNIVESPRFHSRYDMLTWEAIVASSHRTKYSVRVSSSHRGKYSPLFFTLKNHINLWSVNFQAAGRHSSSHSTLSGDPVSARHSGDSNVRVGASHRGFWQGFPVVSPRHSSRYSMTAEANQCHQGKHGLLLFDPAVARHDSDYALHTTNIRIVSTQPTITHNGSIISLRTAEVRLDESSYTWLAQFDVVLISDWVMVKVGDPITLDLYGEIFNLIIDEKEMGRSGAGSDITLSLLAVSPLAMEQNKITQTWLESTEAQVIVEELVGPVTWELPIWAIPPGELAAVDSDPIILVQQVVESVGGVIESLPDGSLVCRSKFPVSVPEWASSVPDHIIMDSDTISSQESYVHVDFMDRVVVSNVGAGDDTDEVEYIADEGDSTQGDVRVYPSPWRQVSLLHTGDNQIGCVAFGIQERDEKELVAFEEGKSSTQYPILRLKTITWQYINLGEITFKPDGRELVSNVNGYSLAQITYRTRAFVWHVSDLRVEEIQFLVADL